MSTLQHPRYTFDRWIATGGMGEVWAATDTLLDREVAVKVLKREYADDPVLRARFAAEARHAGALQHPHVASVLDYGEIPVDGRSPLPFLVMELVEGQPLSAMLAGGKALAPEVATDLVAQAAEGVGAAHEIGIVHRDVKPGNLLLTPDGQVKVTDFGVARAADTAPLTLTGHLIGTPHYLSPEQAEGASATPASDVYALGIVLYECLTGAKPFTGESAVVIALMQIRDPLPDFPDGVPQRLQEIIRVATAKNPADRFRDAGALATALRDQSPETRTFLLPDAAAAGAVDAAPDTASAAGPGHRVPPRLLLAGALALLVLVAGVWVALATGNDDAPARAAVPAAAARGTAQVRVDPADYLGLPRETAARRLRDRGLAVTFRGRQNPGSQKAGTVAALTPHGLVDRGAMITLTVWGKPPPPATHTTDGAKNGSHPGKAPGKHAGKGGDKAKGGHRPKPKKAGRDKAGKAGAGHQGKSGKGKSGGRGKGGKG